MLKPSLWVAVAIAVALVSTNLFAQSAKTDKVKEAVEKIGVHGDITVVRSDDQWFYGSVEQIDSGSFTIYEIEQKQRINFSFDQVKKVFKGYGAGAALSRDINGHRIPPSRSHRGLIIVGAGAAALVLVLAVGLRKD